MSCLARFTEVLFNDGVVRDGNAALVYFAVSALVDQLSHGLQIGVPVKASCQWKVTREYEKK